MAALVLFPACGGSEEREVEETEMLRQIVKIGSKAKEEPKDKNQSPTITVTVDIDRSYVITMPRGDRDYERAYIIRSDKREKRGFRVPEGVDVVPLPRFADSIYVYEEGFQVWYTVNVGNRSRFIISGLPVELTDLRVWTDKGFVIKKVRFDTTWYSDKRAADSLSRLRDRMMKRLQALVKRLNAVMYENQITKEIIEASKEKKDEKAAALVKLASRLKDNLLKEDYLQEETERLESLLSEIENELERYIVSQSMVYVETADFKGGKVFVSFRVGSSWSPGYVADVSLKEKKLRLEAMAKLLSKASVPLRTKKIVFVTGVPVASKPVEHKELTATAERERFRLTKKRVRVVGPMGKEPEKEEKTFEQRKLVFRTLYVYKGEVEIPAKGMDSTMIPLFSKTYGVEILTAVYPEMSELAFMSAIFTPDVDLSPGRMQVYVDGQFMAEYFFEGADGNIKSPIFLGYDPLIKGEVKLISKDREISGKYAGQVIKEEIKITNYREKPVEVILYARKPVAGEGIDEMKVSFRPKYRSDLGDGLVVWKVRLKPKETFRVERTVEVKYPKGRKLKWK